MRVPCKAYSSKSTRQFTGSSLCRLAIRLFPYFSILPSLQLIHSLHPLAARQCRRFLEGIRLQQKSSSVPTVSTLVTISDEGSDWPIPFPFDFLILASMLLTQWTASLLVSLPLLSFSLLPLLLFLCPSSVPHCPSPFLPLSLLSFLAGLHSTNLLQAPRSGLSKNSFPS